MMKKLKSVSLLLLRFCVLVYGNLRDENKIRDLIYKSLESVDNVCVRRSNYTHAVGCQSKLGGQSGVLFRVDKLEDVELLTSSSRFAMSYVPILTSLNLLNREVMMKLRESGKVEGVLVTQSTNATATSPEISSDENEVFPLSQFSTANQCPNSWLNSGEDSHCPSEVIWNPVGSGLYYESFEFPVVFLPSESDVQSLFSCYNEFNEPRSKLEDSYPLCSVKIDTFQYSSGNSDVCMRRSQRARIVGSLTADLTSTDQCSPLGGLNTFGQLTSRTHTTPYEDDSVIVIAARVDANSYFYSLDPLGTQAYASGILAILGVMDLLKPQAAKLEQANVSVVFIAFDAEFFDNSGSIRAVYDMSKGVFPQDPSSYSDYMAELHTKHIRMYLELSQLANATDSQYYAYSTLNASQDEKFTELLDSVSAVVLGKQVERVVLNSSSHSHFPPSSLLSFLREKDTNADQFPAIVITDHKGSFHNSFYGDSFDVPMAFGLNSSVESGAGKTQFTDRISKVSEFIATIVVRYSTKELNDEVGKKEEGTSDVVSMMEEYAYCLLVNVNCSIINSFIDLDIYQEGASSRYVSIADLADTSSVLTIFRYLFYYALREEVDLKEDKLATSSCQPASDTDGTFVYFKIANKSAANENSTGDDSNYLCFRSPVSVSNAESPAFLSESLLRSGKYPAWTESFWSSTFSVKLFTTGDNSIDIMAFTVGIMLTVASYAAVFFAQYKSDTLFVFAPEPLDQTGCDEDARRRAAVGPSGHTLGMRESPATNPAYTNSNSTPSVSRDELNHLDVNVNSPKPLAVNDQNPISVPV